MTGRRAWLGIVGGLSLLAASGGSPAEAQKPPICIQTSEGQVCKPAANFYGEWTTTTSQGSVYTMKLLPKADSVSASEVSSMGLNPVTRIRVRGSFTHNTYPIYNGTIDGGLTGNKLSFNYVQPASKGSGTGAFTLSADGQSFTGDITTDDKGKKIHVGWNGRLNKSFTGVWTTKTSQNGRFEILIEEAGGAVLGWYTNLDGAPQYNGTFLGNLGNDRQSFTFRGQSKAPNAPVVDGTFRMTGDARDPKLEGTFTLAGDKKGYTWSGRKREY